LSQFSGQESDKNGHFGSVDYALPPVFSDFLFLRSAAENGANPSQHSSGRENTPGTFYENESVFVACLLLND
jgi:hypothetical protein